MAEPRARDPRLPEVARAFLRRDFLVARSYRLAFVLRVASVLVALAAFGAMARFVGGPAAVDVPGGLFGFWVVGLALAELFHVAVSCWSTRLREAQLEGTLEAVLSTPARDGHVVLAVGLHDLLTGLLRFAIYLVAGVVVFDVPLGAASAPAALAVFAVALVAFVGVGLVGGALTMSLRRTDPISALAWVGAATLGGVFYPIEALPAWLQPLAALVPIAPALAGLRTALFLGRWPAGDLLHLVAFAAVAWPLAIVLLRRALRSARADGSLGQF